MGAETVNVDVAFGGDLGWIGEVFHEPPPEWVEAVEYLFGGGAESLGIS